MSLGRLDEAEEHLLRSKRLFQCFADSVREAQVNETLAELYMEKGEYALAHEAVESAVAALELTDGEAALAEALRTAGVVAARQARFGDAKKRFEAAYKVAERCGDQAGAGRALLIMFEEMGDQLDKIETLEIAEKLKRLLGATQQTALRTRVQRCIEQVVRQNRKEGLGK